jgi:hypothetical protein
MFSASTKSGKNSGATVDAQFNYVTMLLHGDGTNGAQNNTFLDSSTNNFTITRNGNTTQGSFSPYGSNWSNNLVSSATTYFVTPSSSSLALGTGDFTVEAWVNFSSLPAGGRGIFQFSSSTSIPANTNSLACGASSTSGATWQIYANDTQYNSGASAVVGTWYHIAVVRSSGTTKLYLNGTSIISQSDSKDYTQTYLIVGGFYGTSYLMDGYISNFRVVKGTAVYTANFTPSTTPLTAITNTSLLTCQSNRFVDNSTNNFTLTLNGNPSVQRFNPFGTSTAYSTSVIGGSGYFDGSGDYLSCGSQSAYAFGTGDFTLNAWFYLTAAPTYMSIADTRSSGWALAIDANRAIYLYSDAVGFVVTSAVGAVPLNAWTYVTVKRVSGTMTLYLNAVSINSASNSTNFSNTTLTIGANGSGGEPFFGYICDFQAIKGTGTTPTLPTAPLTNVTNTSLLLNYQNGAIFDNAMINNLETVDNAQISTSVVKYGTGSLAFDGTGDYLKSPQNQVLNFGTGNFTVEFWANISSGQNQEFVVDVTSGGFGTTLFSGSVYYESWGVSNIIVVSYAGYYNTWTHIAVTRNNGTARMFFNGVIVGSVADTTNFPTSGGVNIGGSSARSRWLLGYLDDVRITKGYARYTANFTPPTAAFPNTGPY